MDGRQFINRIVNQIEMKENENNFVHNDNNDGYRLLLNLQQFYGFDYINLRAILKMLEAQDKRKLGPLNYSNIVFYSQMQNSIVMKKFFCRIQSVLRKFF